MIITPLLLLIGFAANVALPWWAFLLTGTIDGIIFMPLWSFLLAPIILGTTTAKLNFLHGTVAAGGCFAIFGHNGWEFAPFDDEYIYLDDGTKVPYDAEKTHWYRLGRRKFAITWEKWDEFLEQYVDDSPIAEERTLGEDDEAVTYGRLARSSDGIPLYTDAVDHDAEAEIPINVQRVAADLSEASVEQSKEAEIKALRDKGSTRNEFSQKQFIIASLLTIAMAVTTTLLAAFVVGV